MLVEEAQQHGRRQDLGDRGDLSDGVGRHRVAGARVPDPVGDDDAVAADVDADHRTRDAVAATGVVEQRLQVGVLDHRHHRSIHSTTRAT